MPTAFVTGATGFLGAALVRQLVAEGWRVRALLRPQANDLLLRDLPAIERIEGDLLDSTGYRPALSGCDALFHTAAIYTHDPIHVPMMFWVNVEGARTILQAASLAGVPRIVHTSTIGVIYQPPNGSLATEGSGVDPVDASDYVRSKLAGEQIALALADGGAPIIIVHPSAMLGPGDWRPSASGRRFLDAVQNRSGWRQRYPAGGINWTPVQDVARGMILAAERGQPGRRYLLGHRQGNLDARAFARLIAQATGRRPRPDLSADLRRLARSLQPWPTPPAPDAGPTRLTCDPSRAITELGMPQTLLLAAAQAEYAWYREQGYL
ncbi:MAG: NAD-dependent epimerase/dehydratase family protein [Caldilineales bacterium]|nr:NAD-dependent epimerase/dehydratase family protein [Caldilineales bacterium]